VALTAGEAGEVDHMAQPAGATEPDAWGLVVVDMQNDFLSEGGYYARRAALDQQVAHGTMTAEERDRILSQPGAPPPGDRRYRGPSLPRVVANITAVIEHARRQQRPIAYVQAVYSLDFDAKPPFLRRDPRRAHHPCRPHSWGAALIEPIRRLTAEGAPSSRERVIAKHTFDGFGGTGLLEFLREEGARTVKIVGVETHVCVLATALSASLNQFTTVILDDCVWTAQEALGQSALAIFRDAFGSTAHGAGDAPGASAIS
jgi:nicotinamidase-related amidase